MLVQLLLGSVIIIVTILIGGIGIWALEAAFLTFRAWLLRPPHRFRMIVILAVSALVVIGLFTLGVWVWALTFHLLGIFGSFEPALYFALVCYTTLGFGDILLPVEWRLLAGLASANGLLSMGIYTALLVEVVRQVRIIQSAETSHHHVRH